MGKRTLNKGTTKEKRGAIVNYSPIVVELVYVAFAVMFVSALRSLWIVLATFRSRVKNAQHDETRQIRLRAQQAAVRHKHIEHARTTAKV
jgi:hypothetical protein